MANDGFKFYTDTPDGGFRFAEDTPELPVTGSLTGNRIGAGVDNWQANLYGIGEAMGSEWAGRKRKENEALANYQSRMAQRQGGVESYKDVDGVGSALNYVGGLAAQSLPYMAEAAVGGIAARGLSTGLRAASAAGRTLDATADAITAGKAAEKALATRSLVAGTAASYPSSVGDILSNQRDQNPNGDTNLGAAMVGGVPYAALNAIDPLNSAAARGVAFRSVNLLDGLKGKTGGLARAGATGLKVGVQEGLNETGQEVINQGFGRMAVDPNATLTDDSAIDRYKESFVGGFALGGAAGSSMGGWRRSQPAQPQNLLDPNAPVVPPATPPATPPPAAPTNFSPPGGPAPSSPPTAPPVSSVAPNPTPAPVAPIVTPPPAELARQQTEQAVNAEKERLAKVAEQQRKDTLSKYGAHTTADVGGGATVLNWAGKEVTNLGDLAKAQTTMMKADAKRVTEYGIDPVAANEAEHAYAEAWREAQTVPVTPSIFKDKIFSGIVKGGKTVSGMAALAKHEFTKEAERGEGKAESSKLDTLAAFYKNLTGEALDRKSIEDAVAAKAAKTDGSTAKAGTATTDTAAAGSVAPTAVAAETTPAPVAPVARPKTEYELLGEQVQAIQQSDIAPDAKRAAVDALVKGKNLVQLKAQHDAAIAAEKPVEESAVRKDVRRVLTAVFGESKTAARDIEVTMDAMREGNTKSNEIASRHSVAPGLVRSIKSRGNTAFDAAAKKLGFTDSQLLILRSSLEGTLNEDPEPETQTEAAPGQESEEAEIGSRNAEVNLNEDGDAAAADGYDYDSADGTTVNSDKGSKLGGGTRSHHRAALTKALGKLKTDPESKALEKLSAEHVNAILSDEKLLPTMDPAIKDKLVAIATATEKKRIAKEEAERKKGKVAEGEAGETTAEKPKAKAAAETKPKTKTKKAAAPETEVDLAYVDPAKAAAAAWDGVTANEPTVPSWEKLSKDLQKEFTDLGSDNWTLADVNKFVIDNKLQTGKKKATAVVVKDGVRSLVFEDGAKAHEQMSKTIADYKKLLDCLLKP